MNAPGARTASAVSEYEVKTLVLWERPDDVAMLRRVAVGLRALNADHARGPQC